MQIAKDSHVTISFRCHGEDGRVVTDIGADDPLSYIHGHDRLFPGLERGLAGRRGGEVFTFTVPATEAAGEWEEALDCKIAPAAFSEAQRRELRPGARFVGDDPSGRGRQLTWQVIRIDPDGVVASANHPLAGEELRFEGQVLAVRPASERELALLDEVDAPDLLPGLDAPPMPGHSSHRFAGNPR
jgi:FKBP-type peptidyl-prolyl cis-trans isomerase SlyD